MTQEELADRVGLAVANARLHAAMRDSGERLRVAFAAAPVGMALADLMPGQLWLELGTEAPLGVLPPPQPNRQNPQ